MALASASAAASPEPFFSFRAAALVENAQTLYKLHSELSTERYRPTARYASE
jgi:hypothetical protein